jgi:hypothetical protein
MLWKAIFEIKLRIIFDKFGQSLLGDRQRDNQESCDFCSQLRNKMREIEFFPAIGWKWKKTLLKHDAFLN